MGVEALTRVFEHAPHDSKELLVLIALANIADPAGVCWPGHEYLGLYARVKHERNLRQYLRALESTGNIYANKVAHRNQKAMYLVATAMSVEHAVIALKLALVTQADHAQDGSHGAATRREDDTHEQNLDPLPAAFTKCLCKRQQQVYYVLRQDKHGNTPLVRCVQLTLPLSFCLPNG